ncbi:hypothetical protein [Chryseobacterium sp.]|uniref:hypothetical protein n=1 Tax=Chryseobacterium sp. TaxID=1871047 RepID=UPI0025BFBECC|nr:hypothetical protein [Chryseobacterium sp.]
MKNQQPSTKNHQLKLLWQLYPSSAPAFLFRYATQKELRSSRAAIDSLERTRRVQYE